MTIILQTYKCVVIYVPSTYNFFGQKVFLELFFAPLNCVLEATPVPK